MSDKFSTLKKEELLSICVDFGVDVDPKATIPVIVAAIHEDGITWDMAKKFNKDVAEKAPELEAQAAAEAAEEKASEEKVLMKFLRENGTYETRGVKFTKAHPFALVPESDAEWIVENEVGIRYATPKEAADFYG